MQIAIHSKDELCAGSRLCFHGHRASVLPVEVFLYHLGGIIFCSFSCALNTAWKHGKSAMFWESLEPYLWCQSWSCKIWIVPKFQFPPLQTGSWTELWFLDLAGWKAGTLLGSQNKIWWGQGHAAWVRPEVPFLTHLTKAINCPIF